MERQQQPPEDLPPQEQPTLEPPANAPLPQKFSAELVASIRETISKKSGQPSSDETLNNCLREIASHHSSADVTDLMVATDIVKALATAEFPGSPFHDTIDRFSEEIAEILLADPVCHDQLLLLWKSLKADPK